MSKIKVTKYTKIIINMILHVNDIKLESKDKFSEQFNLCSDYWKKAHDKSLTKVERQKYYDLWFEERQRLELGIY